MYPKPQLTPLILHLFSNEMIKNSPENIQDMLLKYINICLKNSIVSGNICFELITPLFKDGLLDDPNNYRGICISSALLKLMCSLINNRLQRFAEKNNLVSKNQIGFKKQCRTSDHLLTLKAIVKKYVTLGKKKIFACFVDFKKAFDSVWHQGLFFKLENLGIKGNILNLIKDIYRKTKCAVKVDGKITDFFDFTKGVSQGCPLSPLLFNIYVNDIFDLVDKNTPVSPELKAGNPINVLMYADDLVMLSQSEDQLQKNMSLLNDYCENWNLEINTKKTKTMVFNRGNKLCKTNIFLNNKLVECVKEFKYLGFNISAKNCSFLKTISDLKTKANRAIFALNNKIKLSKIPTKLAIKIFNAQIKPILLYGSEVWASYHNYTYENWDTCETEKCHTQFLKRILGCDVHSPNLMIRGELGITPLLSEIVYKSVSYLQHLEQIKSSLANQALIYELENNDCNNILQLCRQYKPDIVNNLIATETNWDSKQAIQKQCKEAYHLIWIDKIKQLPKATSYNYFKYYSSSYCEKYINIVTNTKHKIALSRFRVSSHSLNIEKGRHARPKIERSDRKCPFCKTEVEDECHFITACPLYKKNRNELYSVIKKVCSNFDNLTDTQKLIYIMRSENPDIIKNIAKFISESMNIRKDKLNKI